MTRADVIVIGAGVVGCSIAYHLARQRIRVLVLDKAGICAGMSARSGALVRMHYTYAPEAELAWQSLAQFENWRETVGGDCGFTRCGFAIVVGAENAERLRANVAMLKLAGVETEVLSASELGRLEPAARLNDVALAACEPRSGYADPVATTRSLAEAARRLGVEFAIPCEAAAIRTSGGRAAAVIDSAGHAHEADAVCVVAGPWSDRLLKPLGAAIGITPERAQIAFFRRPSELRHCVYIDTIAGCYFRPHGDDLTMAGLGAWNPESAPDPDNFDEHNDSGFIETVHRRFTHRIPQMAGTPYARGHAGIYDTTADGRAALGAVPGIEGLFVAAGFSGTGFKTAPAVGAAMAELIANGASRTADLRAFDPQRFRTGRLIATDNDYRMPANFGHKL
jgi:sarcosine oxidase subunit beta